MDATRADLKKKESAICKRRIHRCYVIVRPTEKQSDRSRG